MMPREPGSLSSMSDLTWIKTSDAAALLGLDKATVRKLGDDGRLGMVTRGRRKYFRSADVAAYIEASRIRPGAPA